MAFGKVVERRGCCWYVLTCYWGEEDGDDAKEDVAARHFGLFMEGCEGYSGSRMGCV